MNQVEEGISEKFNIKVKFYSEIIDLEINADFNYFIKKILDIVNIKEDQLNTLILNYYDDDGDNILIVNQEDYKIFFQQVKEKTVNTLILEIKEDIKEADLERLVDSALNYKDKIEDANRKIENENINYRIDNNKYNNNLKYDYKANNQQNINNDLNKNSNNNDDLNDKIFYYRCNKCGEYPILFSIYYCAKCPEYLCEKCNLKYHHDHILIKYESTKELQKVKDKENEEIEKKRNEKIQINEGEKEYEQEIEQIEIKYYPITMFGRLIMCPKKKIKKQNFNNKKRAFHEKIMNFIKEMIWNN